MKKITKAFNVRLLAAERQNILTEVQFSALTQLDFLILLQKGIFHIFQKLHEVVVESLFPSLILFHCQDYC